MGPYTTMLARAESQAEYDRIEREYARELERELSMERHVREYVAETSGDFGY